MISITPLSLLSININLGPSITGIGQIGTHLTPITSESIRQLYIPFHPPQTEQNLISMLGWHTRTSDFVGREKEIDDLIDWLNCKPAVSVKFVIGEGGVGKSRLAAEFAYGLRDKGWSTGFVNLFDSINFPVSDEGTLIVVDYPEEQRDHVNKLLHRLTMLGENFKIRVLFLTRRGFENWSDVIQEANANTIVNTNPLYIGRLDSESGYKLYCSALEKASAYFHSNPPPLSKDAFDAWTQISRENERALFILAIAVYSASHPNDEIVRYSGREIVYAIATREMSRLVRSALGMGVPDGNKYVFLKILAMAAIADRISLSRFDELSKIKALKIRLPSNLSNETALNTSGILSGEKINPLKPDIIAACLVVKTLSKDPKSAPELIWHSMQENLHDGLERISRLSRDAEVVLGIHEYRISSWFEKAVIGKPERCALLEPFFSEVNLPWGWMECAVACWRTLLNATDNDIDRARILNNLSSDLSAVGDTEGALEAIREASEIRRRLSEANPARFEPDLAMSLNNLSGCMSAVGDTEGALEASREASELYRRLSEANPARFEPDLARSYGTYGSILLKQGRYSEASETFKNGIDLIRPFAIKWPDSPFERLLRSLESDYNKAKND